MCNKFKHIFTCNQGNPRGSLNFENELDLNAFEKLQVRAMNKLSSHSFLAVPCPKLLNLDINVKVNNSVHYTNKQPPPCIRSKQVH